MAHESEASGPLTNVDSAWLRMENPTNLMTITVLLTSDEQIDFKRLKALIEDRLLPHERFRQRVVEPWFPFANAHWEEDPSFALKAHLRRLVLPHPADQGTLQETIGELMSTPLDFSKPLWQWHLIENYAGGSALVIRIHHCIGDGIALVRLMFSFVDEERDPPWPTAVPVRRDAAAAIPATGLRPRRRSSLLDEGLGAILHPFHAVELAMDGASAATELAKLVAMSSDPVTVFKGRLGVMKRAVWSDAVPLDKLKAIGHGLGATLNDVLLTAVTGALRTYMLQRGRVPAGLAIRAVVPVNLRSEGEVDTLGNRFGLVFLALPVGASTVQGRLVALKRAMDQIKGSAQAMVAFGVLNAMGMASPAIEEVGVRIFARKATAVMTNVPGPQKLLYLAGAPIQDIVFWVPQSGRLGLGVSILSYNGRVRLGLAVDAGLVPDPGRIITCFHRELERLERRKQDCAVA